MRAGLKILLPVVLELIIFGGLLGAALFLTPSSANVCIPTTATSSLGQSGNSTVHVTIIESDTGSMEGMNGSAHHLVTTPWPVIRVSRCQTVVILVENINSSEPHGFAINHYFDTLNGVSNVNGIELYPGQSFTMSFVANEAGTFKVYCSVFCVIHPFMQNGEMIVS